MKPNIQTYEVQDIYWINILFVVSLTINYVATGGKKEYK